MRSMVVSRYLTSIHRKQIAMDRLEIFGLAGLAIVTLVLLSMNNRRRLAHIPTIGGQDLPLLSLIGSYRFIVDGTAMLQEGYKKYKGKAFKVAMPDRWIVMLSGSALVNELRKLPSEVMSFHEAANQLVATKFTLGPEIAADSWHDDLIRGQLNRSLGTIYPNIHDEIVTTLEQHVGETRSDWAELPAMKLVQDIVFRASNRVIVGKAKCRDQDWINLNVELADDVVLHASILNLFPSFLKPLIGRWLPSLPSKIKRASYHLEPLVAERRQQLAGHSCSDDKSGDMLLWLLSDPRSKDASLKEVTTRILSINFAAGHTMANACTHAMFTLAANPELVDILRQEATGVTASHKWSKASMSQLTKLDSFLRENMRFYSFTPFALARIAMKCHTFCDGTMVPTGTLVAVPMAPVHGDPESYDRAEEFLPFRFASGSEADVAPPAFTTPTLNYLQFGHGRHTCPGRFFASVVIKTILTHLILNYDIRTEIEGVRPSNRWLGPQQLPHPTAKVLFKRRIK